MTLFLNLNYEIVFVLMYDIMFELELEFKLSKLHRCAAPLLMARQAWASAPRLGADCLCGSALQACGATAGGAAGVRRQGGWRGRPEACTRTRRQVGRVGCSRSAAPAAVARQRRVRRPAWLVWLLDSGGSSRQGCDTIWHGAAVLRRRLPWRGTYVCDARRSKPGNKSKDNILQKFTSNNSTRNYIENHKQGVQGSHIV
jgi:hypothetical protein